MGYAINGGFAEYAVGYARHVVRVPDGVDPADAAPLTCAGVTTYKAVKVSERASSDLVAVFGVGGLGHLAVQYARITGRRVVAVDVNEARLRRRARSAPSTRQRLRGGPGRGDPAPRRRRRRDRHRGLAEAFQQAYRSLRARRQARLRRPAAENHMRSRSSRPSSARSRSAARSSARATTSRRSSSCHRRGLTSVEYEERHLHEVNDAIEQVLDGRRPHPAARLPHGPARSRRDAGLRHQPSRTPDSC
jgi:propanol-preferring alcohol dehydrogenase